MMAKKKYVIQFKYPNKPWFDWTETIVKSIVDHYENECQKEHPDAEVRVISP